MGLMVLFSLILTLFFLSLSPMFLTGNRRWTLFGGDFVMFRDVVEFGIKWMGLFPFVLVTEFFEDWGLMKENHISWVSKVNAVLPGCERCLVPEK